METPDYSNTTVVFPTFISKNIDNEDETIEYKDFLKIQKKIYKTFVEMQRDKYKW